MSRFKCCFIIIQLYIFFSCLISADLIDSKSDLPTEKELHKYLSAVINVVDFCAEYKDQVDINLAFGLFMTNLNLIHTLRKKWRTIPKNVKNKIKNTIDENNEILNVFILKQSSDKDGSKTQRRILTLFNNASYWVESMEEFVYTVEKQFTTDRSREKYSPFSLYQKNVGNIYKWFPNPVESDTCLASLSKNPTNMKTSPLPCSISDFCYDMLKRGTNFGYSLTHRIVFLLMARFGRGCTVHSEQTDRALLKRFCSTAHAEAAYIAENNYGLVDLFMEIMALCAFDGQSQFLRRIWLASILKFQTADGCYGDVPVKKMNLTGRSLFTMESGKHNIIQHDGCNPHTTGLAAATFSAAVRFIIEEYY